MRLFARAMLVALVVVVAVAPASARRPRPVAQIIVTVQGGGVVTAPGINCRQGANQQGGQPRANLCTARSVVKPMTFHAAGAKLLMWGEDCPWHGTGKNECTIPLKVPKTQVMARFSNRRWHPPPKAKPDAYRRSS